MKILLFIIFLSALFVLHDLRDAQGFTDDDTPTVTPDGESYPVKNAASPEFKNVLQSLGGNSTLKAFEKENRLAGLKDYLTGHVQAELNGKGWQYRKSLLLYYENYAVAEKELPLRECLNVSDEISRTVCAGKETMLFHMLRGITGEDAFYGAMQSLIQGNRALTSWSDIRTAFEKASGKSLEWFFSQWLDRNGRPEFTVEEERVTVINGVKTVSFDILQKGEPFRFELPVVISTDRGKVMKTLHVEKEKESFALAVEGTPRQIIIDSDYDVMRKLSRDESPPLISGLLGDDKKLLILPDEGREKYNDFIEGMKQAGFSTRGESEIRDEDIRASSLLVLGYEGPVVKRLFGSIGNPGDGFSLEARKNPLNASKIVAVAFSDTKDNIPSAETIQKSGQYSQIRFRNGVAFERSTEAAARGIEVNVYKPAFTIQPAKLTILDNTLDMILNKTLIYAGERHMNYEDHKTQLELIMNLHERGHTFAIGMEMFQRPFQRDIDDYLSGNISEKEFLKRTQYFKRWQFDYNLYREIIEYAKAKKIPVIALNLWTEIIKKVSTDGLDSLTDIERTELPASMDMTDEEYRERLEEVFRQHKSHESKSFDNFYQAQILWDETMAQSIDEFLRKNPGYQMIVLAGAGHLMYGSGIPKRAYRLNKKDYVIILPGGDFIDRDIGDYLVAAEPLVPPTTLKLGVILKERNGNVEIEKVVPGSIAKSAGLEKGDILLSLNDWEIEDIDDVNIFMFDKKRGEEVAIKVLRKKFLVGYREVVLRGTI